MIKLETSKMTKAIERAKAIRPRVSVVSASERIYRVWRRERHVEMAYTVRFVVVNGMKLAECDCKAGQRDQMCYHVAAAAGVNMGMGIQGMRKAAPPAPSGAIPVCPIHKSPMKPSRKAGKFYCAKKVDDGEYCRETA